MLLLGARPTDRGILAATLAVAGAAIIALTSGYPDSIGRLLSDAPMAVTGAEAATTPAPASRNRRSPAPTASPTFGDERGVALYLLIESARPQPLFAR
ncbi:MAG TPA: hypothetical protein VNW24_03645 [Stellaceae bacterium]|jgi:hypothetical protein|nr:hypothetical protein [Stellaceae bacterium]